MSISQIVMVLINIVRVLLDFVLVWFVLNRLMIAFSQNMRTLQLFKGVLMVFIVKLFTSIFGLATLDTLVNILLASGIIIAIIIFQPEIRSLLEKIGQTRQENKLSDLSEIQKQFILDELCTTITNLAASQTGALITFERTNSLIDYIQTGTEVNASIKSELLETIFYDGTPLHDGAVIIKGDKIAAASAFFPSTQKELSPIYGARHRAAIGISEITDSLTVVVSEETGTISFALNGELIKISRPELKSKLMQELVWFDDSKKDGDLDA
ncbi:MAG: diadenylate cyclase CdaA [Erysipelotrichaceae bacterium]|nr:diadenylate cyclase CdaA [Erysipelotrichaceae bacterium]MDD3809917.1 diadenylate cyclase CdaA [Erysipelotrichaceae bacterium]